jgi:hypothetical protein
MPGVVCKNSSELRPYGIYTIPEISNFSIPERYECWGVHAIGENAAEIVHIGQAVLRLGATIEYFRDTVFNYPTLAEAYKLAALDGLNKL